MSPAMNRITGIAAAIVLLVAGFAGGRAWTKRHSPSLPAAAAAAPQAPAERKVLYWYDPMVPDQRFDKPGKSPFMDMELVPRYADETVEGGVRIDAGLRQNVGIRTREVTVEKLGAALQVPGTLTWDLTKETVVSARMEGVIARVQVKAPFTDVWRGQTLATVQAPAWNSAVAEAEALGHSESPAARGLQAAARQRLRSLGVPAGAASADGIALSAAQAGVVTEVLAREGQTVMPGAPLFKINGLDTLWLEASVPQAALAGLRPGTPVEATVSAWPGQVFAGRVQALLPQVDMASRTQRARIVLDNPQRQLAPGMFAEVLLHPQAEQAHPVIPTEALIATGRDSRVIVQAEDGSFRPVRIRTGRSVQGRTEVLAGLSGGERVVVSGQFLLDSEASLSGALERLEAPQADEEAQPAGEATADVHAAHGSHDASGDDHPTHAAAPPAQQMQATKQPSPSLPPAQVRCPVQYWYDPMVPDQRFDKPGKSPFMDMQLVPRFAREAAADCKATDVMPDAQEATP